MMNREERREFKAINKHLKKLGGGARLIQRANYSDAGGIEEIIDEWVTLLLCYDKKQKYGVETKEKAREGIIAALEYIYNKGARWPDFIISIDNPVTFSLDNKQWMVIDIPPDGVTNLAAYKFNKNAHTKL